MLIAISQRQDRNKHGNWFDNLDSAYAKYLEKFGINILPLPNSPKHLDYYFKELPIKGVILSSGNDVNPKLYGSKYKSESVSSERDSAERKILEISIKGKLPVLGLCRGMQFINVFFGGKLVLIKQDTKSKIEHVAFNREIKIVEKNAKKLIGSAFDANSFHNCGISQGTLSKKLRAFATNENNLIEGIYHPKLPIAGIMWHPERKSPNDIVNKKIVQAFLNKKLFWKDG